MTPPPRLEAQPWFMALFLITWLGAMAYVTTFVAAVVRIRELKGEGDGSFADAIHVMFNRGTRGYLRWMFSDDHRALGDPAVTRMAMIVRALFVALCPAMLAVFTAGFWGRQWMH